jgi:hypothetical protein
VYGIVSLIDVRVEIYVGVCRACWSRVSQVVGEIGGEVFRSECNLGYF